MQQEADRARAFTRRAVVLGGAQVGLFAALVARLYGLQVLKAGEYALLADDNRINQRLLIPPRGRILDRQGRPLAQNMPTYRVRVVREQAGDIRATVARLAKVVAIEPKRIDEVADQAHFLRPFVPITVREDLSWEEVSLIAVNAPDLPGVLLDSGLLRDYPHGPVLAHVLGYVGAVNQAEQAQDSDPLMQLPDFRIGKNGIEHSYDKPLRGRSGLSRVEVNAVGREIRELDRREGEPGQDLRLSLDLDLQRFCDERLSAELAACAVVLDIRTGGILALSSVPSFDPRVFTGGLTHALWTELSTSPRTPLVNKCIRGQYPPGSTFKTMTAMAGLEAGAITPSTENLLRRRHRPGLGPLPLLEGARPRPAGPHPGDRPVLRLLLLRGGPPGRDRRPGRHRQPLRPRRQARHRPAGRADRPHPDQRLEEEEVQGRLAEGRDAGLRHRPGLRQRHPAPARGHDRPPVQRAP